MHIFGRAYLSHIICKMKFTSVWSMRLIYAYALSFKPQSEKSRLMKLIGTYVSPYARRVATALVSRAIPYEHEDLNGYADPIRAREFNPVGKVPVLELDDGERLIDSGAILDHINEL